MNVDKNLIKHWAMLFESEEMKNNGGFSDGFNEDEIHTLNHHEMTMFDLKNEKMYGRDDFFKLMMYGFYDRFFLNTDKYDEDGSVKQCIQGFFDAIGKSEWPYCDDYDKNGKSFKYHVLSKGKEKDFFQFLRDYAKTQMVSPYGRKVSDPQFLVFQSGGGSEMTSFADSSEAHEYIDEWKPSEDPDYVVKIGAESTGDVVSVYEGDSLEDAKSAMEEILKKYGNKREDAYFNMLMIRDWKDGGRGNETHAVYIPKEEGQHMGYSS